MKQIFRIILFVATLVLIAASVMYVAMKIGEIRLNGEQSASAEYTILRNAVAPITSEQELGDQFIRDRLKSLYNASAHLLAVQVLDRNGLVLWKMPDESAYFGSPATTPGSVFRAPGLSTVIYMTPLPDGMKMMALYSILSQRDIANTLLLPIIALAVWIVLLVILQFVLKEKPAAYAAPAAAPPVAEPQAQSEAPPEGETESASQAEMPAQPSEIAQPDEEIIAENEEIPATKEKPSQEEAPHYPEPEEQGQVSEEAEVPEMMPEPELQPEPEEEPIRPRIAVQEPEYDLEHAEFVSPPPSQQEEEKILHDFPPSIASGALERALESQLQTRQDEEISLMLIHCVLAGESDPSALALGVTIREYFASDTLVFELAKGCHAAILPGVDTGSCLKLAVDLDDVLTTTASLYKDLSAEPPFYFGISARYGRTVSPARLYKEAYAALQKARESESRILAFKPVNQE
jgi:hypothetical protein